MAGPMLHTGRSDAPSRQASGVTDCLELRAYRMLTRLARPAVPYILRFRESKGKEDPQRRGERLGRASILRPDGALVWVHAASVGETSAVLPLMERMTQLRPGVNMLLTTGTVTSAGFAASRLGTSALHQYVPLDEPSYVSAFLDYWQPSLGIFTEQEVWPNLVLSAARRGIPLALVNARMSDRSFERWQKCQGLAAALFSHFEIVLAQNAELARRFERIGASRALVVGNLKVDSPAPPVGPVAFARLQQALASRPRFVAASTHADEEIAIAEAFKAIRTRIEGLIALVAPRHPERGAAVAEAIAGLGLTVRRRALGQLPDRDTDVYIADTIGELGTFYAASPVAFIGGSLIPHGGQNPIEAVRHNAVVVTGPSIHNFSDAYGALLASGGALQVKAPGEIAPVLAALLSDAARIEEMRENATRGLAALSGALERSAAALLPYFPAEEDKRVVVGG